MIFKKYLSLTIGTYSVKIMHSYLSIGGEHRILKYAERKIWDIRNMKDPHQYEVAFSNRIKTLLIEEDIDTTRTIINISGKDTFLKYITLPRLSKWKIHQLIKYEAINYIPEQYPESSYDYILIDTTSLREKALLFILYENALRRLKFMENYIGLDIKLITHTSFSLYYGLKEFLDDSPTLLIDTGVEHTELLFIMNKNIVFGSTINFGGRNYDMEISSTYKLPIEEAEMIKIKEGSLYKESGYKIRDSLVRVSNIFISNLKRVIKSAALHTGIKKLYPQKIIFTGGTSCLKGLKEYLSEQLEAKVIDIKDVISSPIENFYTSNPDAVNIISKGGIKNAENSFPVINLMPIKQKERKLFYHTAFYSYLIIFFVILFIGIKIYLIETQLKKLEELARSKERMFQNITQENNKLSKTIQRNEELKKELEYLYKIKIIPSIIISFIRRAQLFGKDEVKIHKFTYPIEEETQKIPKSLLGVQVEGSILCKKSKTQGYEILNSFVNFMERDIKIEKITITRAEYIKEGDFKESILFQLKIYFKVYQKTWKK